MGIRIPWYVRFMRHEEGFPGCPWYERAGLPLPSPDNMLGFVYADMLDDYLTAKYEANKWRVANGLSPLD